MDCDIVRKLVGLDADAVRKLHLLDIDKRCLAKSVCAELPGVLAQKADALLGRLVGKELPVVGKR